MVHLSKTGDLYIHVVLEENKKIKLENKKKEEKKEYCTEIILVKVCKTLTPFSLRISWMS